MENLLDKFIRNEKKAKLWAALSLLAFCTVATTVIVVSYQLKNGKDTGLLPPTHDTLFVSKEDTSTATLLNDQAETIRLFKDSVNKLQVKYEMQLNEEKDRYILLLEKCESKPPGGDPPTVQPPKTEPVSVVIYTLDASAVTSETLMKFTQGASIGNNRINVSIQQSVQKNKPRIMYSDPKYKEQAEYIAKVLNNSNVFSNWYNLSAFQVNPSFIKADIGIWLGYVNVNTDKK